MIPPRIRLRGDLDKAREYIDLGKSQLLILHRMMEFQGLKQHKRKISFNDGTFINITSSFGSDVIVIETPYVAVEEEEVPEEEIEIIMIEPKGIASRTLAGNPALTVTIVSDECCPSINKMQISCPASIPTSHTEDVSVYTGGCPPFEWSVAGTDFSLLDGPGGAGTDGRNNRLYCGGGAAGQATITVRDDCGDEVQCVVDCSNCGYWALYEEGESVNTGGAGCDDCYVGDCEDEGEHNNCDPWGTFYCYSDDGKQRWTMSAPGCWFAGDAACSCDCWGDWTIFHVGYPDHGDPSLYPPNCNGYENTPCGLNLGYCYQCEYDGNFYDCISCVYRHYVMHQWIDT